MKLSKLSNLIQPSPIREMLKEVNELRRNSVDVIQLSTGQPSLPLDEEVLNFLISKLRENPLKVSSYSPTAGIPELREKICHDLSYFGKIDVEENEVLITEGGSEGLLLAALTLFDKDDEVIILEPTYVSYPNVTIIAGAKPIFVSQKMEESYQPNLEEIKSKINSKTKAIMFATPDNPTGRVLDEKIAKGLIEIAKDYQLYLIVDEAYKHLIYEGEHFWFWRYEDARDRVVCINTFSKDPAMTGFRLGYAYGPKDVISVMERIKQYTTLCSNTPAQIAAIKYLEPKVKEKVLSYTLQIYKKRRDALIDAMEEYLPYAKFVKPKGAMYLFANFLHYFGKKGIDDKFFMMDLIKKKYVAVISGSNFGPSGANHIRITFVGENEDRIRLGIRLIKEYLNL
jgi:Aspartate/tyrosine/aromatic aminotransferase